MSVQREKRCLVALPKKSASSSLLHLSLYLSLPSPNKLCHLSYLLELHKERYVGPQLASNMKDVRYNVRRCNTLRRVAELLEKRESAKPANVTGRFDAISVWPTEQVMARRAMGRGVGVKKEGVARAGARSQQLHCMSLARCLEG